ncbi:MAG: hypothetical protein JO104_11985, partial [Candidatus Eremiobacteraeota bacterium]|nr:hypothetical protein [Candidatus Eremiobacteraeota bacterium]
MRRSSRGIASTLGVTLALTACGGQNLSVPPQLAGSAGSTNAPAVRETTPGKPLISIPRLYGDLAYADAGRRPDTAPVRVSLTLRYNHQAELDTFVAAVNDPSSRGHRKFLTAKEFDDYYAPTRAQEERVVKALRQAGFTIAKRYANRTIVDATARTALVERFFSTEIHTVRQGKYGERYTNVKPATVPSAIAALVRDVSLNDLIVVRTVADQSGVENQR